jgi:hypothetical protein
MLITRTLEKRTERERQGLVGLKPVVMIQVPVETITYYVGTRSSPTSAKSALAPGFVTGLTASAR